MRSTLAALVTVPLLALTATSAFARIPPGGLDPIPWCEVMYDDCLDDAAASTQHCVNHGGTLEECFAAAMEDYQACIEAADEVCISFDDFPGLNP